MMIRGVRFRYETAEVVYLHSVNNLEPSELEL